MNRNLERFLAGAQVLADDQLRGLGVRIFVSKRFAPSRSLPEG